MAKRALRTEHHITRNIDEHVALIARQVERSLKDAESRQLAVRIVSNKVEWRKVPGARNGEEAPFVRGWGQWFRMPAVSQCPPRQDACEVDMILNFIVLNCRYVYDIDAIDTFATLQNSLDAGGGDCFPTGTQLLRSDGTFIAIDDVKPGMRIWGKDRWSEITRKWFKGDLPVTVVELNNGDKLQLTEDHKVYVLRCKHGHSTCGNCDIADWSTLRIPVAELEEDMVLLQPETVGMPEGEPLEQDARMAELIGLYLADGWSEECRIGISGKDGHPKEAQKHHAKALAEALGFNTGWHERYLRVYGIELAERFAAFGTKAPEKRLPHVRVTEATLQPLVCGLLADSGLTNGGTTQFTTTSAVLAAQLRVLLRMQGISCGHAYIENHGGLGKNPIHRLYLRQGAKGKNKRLKVKAIHREMFYAPCWDISTDDHYVYLPDADTTVSNCDDATIAFGTLLRAVGFQMRARVIATSASPNDWSHIYPLVGMSKDDASQWVPLDVTVTGAVPGWEYSDIAKYKDYQL